MRCVAVLILHKMYIFWGGGGRVVETVVKYSVNMFPNIDSSCNCRFPENPPN